MSESNSEGYFHRVVREASSFPWINSAVQAELESALKWGAVGNTMNPSHPPKAIRADRQVWQPVIDEILRSKSDLGDDEVTDLLTQRMAVRSSRLFLPTFEKSQRRLGYVTIQSNPNVNDDYSVLIAQAVKYSQLGPNVLPKIPSTKVGATAIEELTSRGISTVATMGFSVAQTVAMAEAFEQGLRHLGHHDYLPRCVVVIIPGIYDDYLQEQLASGRISAEPSLLRIAGIAVSRAVYRVFRERGYRADMQVGGTRHTYHITELIGKGVHITHSFDTWKKLNEENPPVVEKISEEIPAEDLKALEQKVNDFRRAYELDGLSPDEFRGFGPCVKFNNSCIEGYSQTKDEVAKRRAEILAVA